MDVVTSKRAIVLFTCILSLLSCLGPYQVSAAVDGRADNYAPLFLGNHKLPPMIFIRDNRAFGIVVDLANAISERMIHPARFEYMNWSQAQQLVSEGKADALLHINPTHDRENVYDFSAPLLESEFSIFISNARDNFHDIRDLKGLKVGVEGDGMPVELLKRYTFIEPVVMPDVVECFHLLNGGIVDAVVVDRRVGAFVIAEGHIEGIRIAGEPIDKSSSAIAVKKGNVRLLAEINQALAKIKEDGTYAQILMKWQPTEVLFQTKEQIYKQKVTLWMILGVLIFAMAWTTFLLYEIRKRRRAEQTLQEVNKDLEQQMGKRKRVEEERQTAVDFLQIVNECVSTENLVRSATEFFHQKSGCEAVGIRIRQAQDYPYFETRGFTPEFVSLESRLCSRDKQGHPIIDDIGDPVLECMCGNVICGRFDPSKPFFTAKGNFWTNSTTELLARSTEADRQARTRNRCNGEGYESVALIALRIGKKKLGLLQLNDKRPGLFTPETILLWERLANYLSIALSKVAAEEALERLNQSLEATVRERTAALLAANREIEERSQQLRALAGELTTAEQRERKNLARILHDGLQQYLVAAKMQIGGIVEHVNDSATRQTVSNVETLLGESINVSRSLAAELSPPILQDGGILAGMEWLSRWMASKHGLHVNLVMEMDAPDLSYDVKVFLFESVRELLLNVVKYAKADSATVHLSMEDGGHVRVTVSDRGVGFNTESILQGRDGGGGFGLFSIRERIGLISGRFEIDSSPGAGARFSLIAPFDSKENSQPEPALASFKNQSLMPSKPEAKIRILLADDHVVMREALARLLDIEDDFVIIGQAEDGQMAIEMADALNPDIILMDISMPRLNGIDATKLIAPKHPDMHIIGLSLYTADERACEMLNAGAALYLSKSVPPSELKAAIRSCMSGAKLF